ncbi:MAG: restriction endonuclease subunit S [Neisseriaceae bacterium]|nr:restriction endonuclease subunit S [Neisseriaceae bacterium]
MQEIEDNFKSNGGKFEEFRIGDLFEIKSNPQLNKDSFRFSANGEYPYFTRTVLNNGFAGYVDYLDEEHKICGNSLAVGMLGMQFFYMKKDFYAGQFTKTAFPKFKGFNETSAQYFIVLLNKYQKVFQGVLVRDFEELFNDSLIQLPTQNGEIAFDYMEAYIKELEADRVKELEYEKAQQLKAYLIATGLKDYTLTKAEQAALEIFEKYIKINNWGKPYLPAVDCSQQKSVQFQEFKIGELFEKIDRGDIFQQGRLQDNEGGINFIAQNDSNNGFVKRVSSDNYRVFLENSIVIGRQTGITYYQKDKFVTTDGLLVINNPKIINNEFNGLFITSLLSRQLLAFCYTHTVSAKKLVEVKIQLPTQNNAIDFDFMHTFIRAIEKIVIKEVVEWADKKIQATKQVINA